MDCRRAKVFSFCLTTLSIKSLTHTLAPANYQISLYYIEQLPLYLFCPLAKEKLVCYGAGIKRERGGTGRRTGFRFQRGNPWGFESLRSHHLSKKKPINLFPYGDI